MIAINILERDLYINNKISNVHTNITIKITLSKINLSHVSASLINVVSKLALLSARSNNKSIIKTYL